MRRQLGNVSIRRLRSQLGRGTQLESGNAAWLVWWSMAVDVVVRKVAVEVRELKRRTMVGHRRMLWFIGPILCQLDARCMHALNVSAHASKQ